MDDAPGERNSGLFGSDRDGPAGDSYALSGRDGDGLGELNRSARSAMVVDIYS